MKKWIFCLLSLSCLTVAYAETPSSSTPPVNEAVYFSDSFKLTPQTIKEKNEEKRYEININFPQIAGDNLATKEQTFNKLIRAMVDEEIAQFKKYLIADQIHMKTLPEDLQHNTLRIDYDLDVVKSDRQAILSVRLNVEGFQAGRAHPYHTLRTLTFDLPTGKILTLKSLFKPNSNYLKVIANYARKQLNTKLDDKWMIEEGTKPTEKNYKIWNLEDDDLLITFSDYQIAPYVYGAQEVAIPYAELKDIISPTAPIFPCLAQPEICKSSGKKS